MNGGKSSKADAKYDLTHTPSQKFHLLALKDPNKPKRPASAFFIFMEDFRKQFKENYPENKSVAAVGKAGGAKWKSMTDSEKAPYAARADKRMKEYEKALANYNKKQAADDDEDDDDDHEDDSDKSTSEVNNETDEDDSDDNQTMNGGKSSKADAKYDLTHTPSQKFHLLALKDPNKPKRPASAFFIFMEDFRKQFKEYYPENKSVAAIGKAGGAKWKSMTDSEKAPYAARADKRMKEYEKALANYNKKQAADDDEDDDDDDDDDEDDSDKSASDVNYETDEDDSDDFQAQEMTPLGVTKQVDQSMLLEKMVEKQFKEKTEMFESMLKQALGKERDARLATEEAAKIKRMRSNKEIEKLRNSLDTMQLNYAILFLLIVVVFVVGTNFGF